VPSPEVYDVAVIGAGINGLACVHHLLERGVKRIALLEQFKALHARGSSHGFSRITRTTYSSPRYVELIQVAHREDWPRLERAAGKALLHPCAGAFFGPGIDVYLDSLRQVPEVLSEIDVLEPSEARRVFPAFRFPDSEHIVRDRSCAVVAARETLECLLERAMSAGVELREHCRVNRLGHGSGSLTLETSAGEISCGQLIVTAGPWTDRLVSPLSSRLRVAHQEVGYFAPGSSALPVWIYAGCKEDESFYGLPEFGRPGLKVARHRTGCHGDDAEAQRSPEISSGGLVDLEHFVARQFSQPLTCVGYEPCLYTNTPDEDFVLDHHPDDARIVIGAGFSGHGFKFGPLTGRILVNLLLDGHSSVAAFERHRGEFAFTKVAARWA
jgi:monomeric sarcosine oxidase